MEQRDLSIDELVKKVKRREILLPEMQRQYTWRKTRVRDLLDSLYRGWPSGMILTWETDEDVETRDFAVGQDSARQGSFQLLLDGQQRLTSLSAILRGDPVHVRGLKKPIDILFNLEHPEDLNEITEVFEDEETEDDTNIDPDESMEDASEDEIQKRSENMVFVVHSNKLAQLPHWISVTEVFKDSSDASFLRKAGVESFEDKRYEKYVSRLKRLRDIKNYSYRVHALGREKSYEEVTEIFVRVNSLGVKLRSSDLALAQITAKWRGSLQIFQKFEEKSKSNLGLGVHLRNLVVFATGQSRFHTVGSLSKEQLENAWTNAKKGMDFALNFLHSNMNIDSPTLLSSPYIIIALAYYGHLKKYNMSREESSQLRHWALSANAKARYTKGSTEAFLDQDLSALRYAPDIDKLLQLLKKQVGHLNVLPGDLENKSSRSAYFKTMFMAFRKDGASDWRDRLIISLKHSGAKHKLQFHHIFPQSRLRRLGLPAQKINDISNLVFISGSTNKWFGDKLPETYLPALIEKKKIGDRELNAQCIPNNLSLWKIDRYEEFLSERRELIAERLTRFLEPDQRDTSQ